MKIVVSDSKSGTSKKRDDSDCSKTVNDDTVVGKAIDKTIVFITGQLRILEVLLEESGSYEGETKESFQVMSTALLDIRKNYKLEHNSTKDASFVVTEQEEKEEGEEEGDDEEEKEEEDIVVVDVPTQPRPSEKEPVKPEREQEEETKSGLYSSASFPSAISAAGSATSHEHLVLMLLDAANSQFDALQSFIDDIYISLTQKGSVSNDKAWGIIGRCVHHILDSMHNAGTDTSSVKYEIFNPKEEKQEFVTGPIIWSILQSFNKFMQVGFVSHHLIQEELLSFSLKDQYLLSTKTDSLLQWRNDSEKQHKHHEGEIQTLHTIVDELKIEVDDLKQKNMSVTANKQTTPSIVDDVKTQRLEAVEQRIESMGLLAGEDGEKAWPFFSGVEEILPFSSEAEVIQWVKDVDLTTFGEFWDLFSVLHNLLPESLTSRELLLRQHDAKARHLLMTEYYLTSAMSESHYTPSYLESENVREGYDIGGPRVDDGEIHCGFFGWCESMEQWKGAFANICCTMTTNIERYCGEGKASIQRKYEKQQRQREQQLLAGTALADRRSGMEHVLAMKLLDAVKAQWSQLVLFIDESFDSLTKVIPPYEVWPLLGRCVYVIFSSMSQIRHKGILPGSTMALRTEPPTKEERQEKVIGPMIWAVLSCHRSFHESAKDGFLSHPSIIKELKDLLPWMK